MDKQLPGTMVSFLQAAGHQCLTFLHKGGTYAGNPVACAAAVACAEAFQEEKVLENVEAR